MRRIMEARRSTIVSPARYIRDYNFRSFANLILIGCLLAFVAGYVNTICIVGAFQLPLTAITGSTSKMTIVIANGRFDIALHFILLIFSFILGNSISGALVGGSSFRIDRHYGLVLLLESLTLALGSLFEVRFRICLIKCLLFCFFCVLKEYSHSFLFSMGIFNTKCIFNLSWLWFTKWYVYNIFWCSYSNDTCDRNCD